MNIQRGKCSKGRFQGKFSPRIIQSPHKQSTEVNESTFEVPSLLLFSNCSCPALCNPMDCSTPGFPVLRYLPEFAQTRVYWVHDTIQPSHLLPSPSPPASIFPSIRVFSTELALHIRWPKDWSFDFSMSWTTWNRKFSTGKKQNSSPWEMSPRQCCAEKNLAGALFFPMVTPFTLELCPFSKEDSLWLLKILKGDCFSRHLWLLCKYSFFRNRCTDRKNW